MITMLHCVMSLECFTRYQAPVSRSEGTFPFGGGVPGQSIRTGPTSSGPLLKVPDKIKMYRRQPCTLPLSLLATIRIAYITPWSFLSFHALCSDSNSFSRHTVVLLNCDMSVKDIIKYQLSIHPPKHPSI